MMHRQHSHPFLFFFNDTSTPAIYTLSLHDALPISPAHLRPGGWLVMEIGEEQAGALASLMAAQGFSAIGARRDLRGVERYIEGCWAEGKSVVPLTGVATQRMSC